MQALSLFSLLVISSIPPSFENIKKTIPRLRLLYSQKTKNLKPSEPYE